MKAVQINTGHGCHLDAHMVGHAVESLQPEKESILFIENVGNLVCPAAFDLGEAYKVAILSVTEGEDKPLKYPDMFHAADLMLLNKIDLLPHLDFSVEQRIENARRINIVAADTKVVKKGEADQLYITSTCFGVVPEGVHIGADRAREGDRVIISGFIGDHGAAVLASREELSLTTDLQSDSQSVNGLVAAMLASSVDIRCMRDPTRGGLATSLNEIAATSGVGIEIDEGAIPVREGVRAVSELLGLDPLYFACEGRLLTICPAEGVEELLACMRKHPKGENAAIIGEVTGKEDIPLILRSTFGGSRVVSMLTGDQMPRIC